MNALGLVTAAGKSTRMGGFPKPLLWFGSERFSERILRTYSAGGVDDQLVVLGYESDIVQERANLERANVVTNEDYESGMLSSVQLGVRQAESMNAEAMYLWPVDYPCVSPSTVEELWEVFLETDSDIVIPTYQNERGHPALFGNTTFESLLSAPETEGARAVVYDATTDVTELSVDNDRILIDIDTPAEYWEAVRRYEPDQDYGPLSSSGQA